MLRDLLVFTVVLTCSGLLLAATLIVLMARTLLRPRRMNDGRATVVLKRLSPGDLNMPFEELSFQVRDERTGQSLHLAAWWIPCGRSERTALLIHGYSDAKVGAIAWAPTLHALGWNVLAIDLRAHGQSEGVLSTAGYWERHDVAQIINQFRAMRPLQTQALVLFGVSLGAAVALATAALRDDIAGVIMESPFGDYRHAIAAHGQMRGLPGGAMRNAAVRVAEWMSGADFRAVRPTAIIARATCPVMVIHAGDDPLDRKSTRLNSSHLKLSRMPSSA